MRKLHAITVKVIDLRRGTCTICGAGNVFDGMHRGCGWCTQMAVAIATTITARA